MVKILERAIYGLPLILMVALVILYSPLSVCGGPGPC
jgi:hypothetical protein